MVSNGVSYLMSCGNCAGQLRHLLLDRLLDFERVGAGRLEHADAGRRLVVEREHLAVGLRAELDPADVAHARDVAIVAGLDDDVLELAGVVEPAVDVQRVLERLPGGVGGMPTWPAVTCWLCCWIA